MGKIIKDGYAFMKYVNSGLIRKTDDIPELKHKLIALSETKTHTQMSEYAVLFAEHILSISGTDRSAQIEDCIAVNKKWQQKEVHFQAARDAAGVVNDLAREEKDPIKTKVLRAMGQVAATPHVRWHALAASEYGVVIVNLMYPGDMVRVRDERERQIELMQCV